MRTIIKLCTSAKVHFIIVCMKPNVYRSRLLVLYKWTTGISMCNLALIGLNQLYGSGAISYGKVNTL